LLEHACSILQALAKARKDIVALPVKGGMRTVAPTQQPAAATYMFAPSAPHQITSQPAATPWKRSNHACHSLCWEQRPCFVCEYVWPENETRSNTLALYSETAQPVLEPPINELLNINRWDVIKTRPHLFRITTPI
jgi:hypothetical protein